MPPILVCLTGASGSIYGLRLISALRGAGREVHALASNWGGRVCREETGLDFKEYCLKAGAAAVYDPEDMAASPASGSFRLSGTVICPCSMSSLGALASGAARNLVHRAGAVALKEGWPLILVPRESPLSLIDLRNLTSLAEAGALILPASPGFYHRPRSVDDLVDQVVCKILDRLGVDNGIATRWKPKG